MADQNSSSMNAIHGTPGWRVLESSMAKGDEPDHRAPDARHQHRSREEEQQELPHDLPEGITREHRAEHQRLPIEDPGQARPDPAPHRLENPAPLLGLGSA